MRASSQAIPDRRQTPRTKLAEIAYIGMGPENGGLVLDVSDGGLSFHAVAPVRKDETINFLLSLRGHSRIEGAGEVVWTNEMKTVCGLRFTSLSAGAREHLSNWTNQTRMPAAALETPLSVAPTEIPQTEESPAPLPVQTLMEVEPVFAIPPIAKSYLSEPAARSLWGLPLFLWITAGILGSAFAVTVFIYGVRVGKSKSPHAAEQFVAVPDSQARPQITESVGTSDSASASDAPSVPAVTPALPSEAPTARGDTPAVPNGDAPRTGAFVNTSKSDGILANPLPPPAGDGGLQANVADQHAEVALVAGKSELAAAQAALRWTNGARDSSKAARLLWAAVANDNSTAAVLLADLYLRGDGVPKSCEQARVLLTAASKSGDAQGQQKLSELNANGCQ